MKKASAKSGKSKPARDDFQSVFDSLRGILEKHKKSLDVSKNAQWDYYVNIKDKIFRGKPLCFGGVHICNSYVSYYLMPVYMNPELQAMISPGLKKRMQGLACFKFKTVEKPLFRELEKITATGLKMFQKMEDVQFG